ncbi:alpha-amylase family glycosyl hydrolase [Rubinisphaera margarita]|uniref:alpha-amylase family glycosyl hydrolase n=1 Tax=Rubinisphaera margarita TaxID=2909586 RepID=UPI001EE948E5|nr:alpha-amylase family glycosyl hydrolase [Rubinisphaera margarita]MCG6157693.1 alpha amylase C-terminal domain-containing protein [Rubinisphaera margarita]
MSTDQVVRIEGMGAIPGDHGVAFRVWAPHAEAVSVIGTFNDWNEESNKLDAEDGGKWYTLVENASIGDQYLFVIHAGGKKLKRIDPYAREVTNSVGNAVVPDPSFDWLEDNFEMPPINELVVYEMHIGTYTTSEDGEQPGTFETAIEDLAHLQRLGVNCIEVMPIAEFAGDYSWGYNPAHIFAVESSYGGPKAFKQFVLEAHKRGIAVVLDVVYNHFGPSDLDLWQFDGWHQHEMGGIYFYNDWKAETPWGLTRPDYGRGEVRQYIFDNAMMWMNDFRVDGLRYDMTLYIRNVRGNGDPGGDIPEGWSLTQWINGEIRKQFPDKITIAEDLQKNDWMTKSPEDGGAGFHAQWDAAFVHPIRDVLTQPNDEDRSMEAVVQALSKNYNGDPFQRVAYTESHDEVANGKARMTSEINPDAPHSWCARKRSVLGAVLTLTAPGVPMLFQGQEFLEDEWFRDTVPLDWDKADEFRGTVRLYRDLIHLRLNARGNTKGLTGSGINFLHVDDHAKVVVYHRWYEGGTDDNVVVAVNFSSQAHTVKVHMPSAGEWKPLFNSDSHLYSKSYDDVGPGHVLQTEGEVEFTIAPYSAVIFGHEA